MGKGRHNGRGDRQGKERKKPRQVERGLSRVEQPAPKRRKHNHGKEGGFSHVGRYTPRPAQPEPEPIREESKPEPVVPKAEPPESVKEGEPVVVFDGSEQSVVPAQEGSAAGSEGQMPVPELGRPPGETR